MRKFVGLCFFHAAMERYWIDVIFCIDIYVVEGLVNDKLLLYLGTQAKSREKSSSV